MICRACHSHRSHDALACGNCGAPAQAQIDTNIGQILSERYLLLNRLSSNVSGVLYLAEEIIAHRDVHVRLLPADADKMAIDGLRRDAVNLGGVDDVYHFVQYVVGVTSSGQAYAAFDLPPGRTLAERIAEGPMPVDDVVDCLRQLATALDSPHAAGLVHRGLCPKSIMISDRVRGGLHVKILDFGLARLQNPSNRSKGSARDWQYMSPEWLAGLPVDPRADLYAIGVLARVMLNTAPVGTGPHRPLEASTKVPAWLTRVVSDLTEANVNHRIASARLLLQRLKTRQSFDDVSTSFHMLPEDTPPMTSPAMAAPALALSPRANPAKAKAKPAIAKPPKKTGLAGLHVPNEPPDDDRTRAISLGGESMMAGKASRAISLDESTMPAGPKPLSNARTVPSRVPPSTASTVPPSRVSPSRAPSRVPPGAVPSGVPPSGTMIGTMPISPRSNAPSPMESGVMPPGALPPGVMPPGALPPGPLSPGALPPGALSPGALPPGPLSPGAMPPPGQVSQSIPQVRKPARKSKLKPILGIVAGLAVGVLGVLALMATQKNKGDSEPNTKVVVPVLDAGTAEKVAERDAAPNVGNEFEFAPGFDAAPPPDPSGEAVNLPDPPDALVEANTLPQLRYESDSGFTDLVFQIRSASFNEKGDCQILAFSRFENTVVGFGVYIRAGSRAPIERKGEDPQVFYRENAVAFQSMGQLSDSLLASMANIYAVRMPAALMKPETWLTAAAEQGSPRDLKSRQVTYRISYKNPEFFGEFAELFLRVQLADKKLTILERDASNRQGIIKALSRPVDSAPVP